MLILLVRRENAALGELEQLVWQCYPGSNILTFTDAAEAFSFVEEEDLDIDLCMTDIKRLDTQVVRVVDIQPHEFYQCPDPGQLQFRAVKHPFQCDFGVLFRHFQP